VAVMARVSEGAVRMWLSRVEPTREKLAAIAKATGVSLDWLVSGRGPKMQSELPPGYVRMRFADLTKSKGVATRPFFSTEQFIFLPLALLGMTESDKIDPMALLLPPDSPGAAADFVVFNFIQKDAAPPAAGSPCVVIEDEERVKVRPVRSSAGLSDMFGPILGPVIFRGAIVRQASEPPAPAAGQPKKGKRETRQ